MPLSAFRKFKETGTRLPLDVRSLGLKTEKHPEQNYPISPDIEIPVTEEMWSRFEQNYRMADKHSALGMLSLLFKLAIINGKRTRELISITDAAFLQESCKTGFIDTFLECNAQFAFISGRETSAILPVGTDQDALIKRIKELHQDDAETNADNLFLTLFYARILFPEVFNDKYCEQYWDIFSSDLNDPEVDIKSLAYYRVMFPKHLSEISLSVPAAAARRSKHFFTLEDLVYSKILARPEIPGLTTWPPEKTAEPELTVEIPPQPKSLAI